MKRRISFMKHVFPMMPILSRSELGLSSIGNIPGPDIIAKIPIHLLAAIYATAFPFASDDDHLSLITTQKKPRISETWKFVHRLILHDTHCPRLSILQAALLYLHRQNQDEQSYTADDTTSNWSMLGIMVGLAHSLGLNLECGLFGLPAHEKRIRRRVWWALYNEDKWMSMTFGRPPYIRSSEWDVVMLDDNDFITAPTSKLGPARVNLPFRSITTLAVIAESIQEKL